MLYIACICVSVQLVNRTSKSMAVLNILKKEEEEEDKGMCAVASC